MSILRFLLFPLAVLYDFVTRLRNHLYDIGNKKSIEFTRPVICVGNLSVGGSGKTPMIEYLVRLLQKSQVAILSRGYGRKTIGFRFATVEDSARTLGDEPYQYFRKFGGKVLVTVGEERALAIPEILLQKPETDVILLDDAYQHRAVKPQFSILLSEFNRPFYSDFLLPMGRLREARMGAKRADVIIITKCDPDISSNEREEVKNRVASYAPAKPVFFTSIQYGRPQPINDQVWIEPQQVVLVSGIAQSKIFESYVRSQFKVIHHFDFPDHHFYAKDHITKILDFCKSLSGPVTLLTTEKDMVRLIPFKEILTFAWFYIPIETVFVENGAEFDAMVTKAIQS